MLFIVIARVGLFPGSGAGFGALVTPRTCAGHAGRAPSSTRPSASSQGLLLPWAPPLLARAWVLGRCSSTLFLVVGGALCLAVRLGRGRLREARARRDTLVLLVGLLTLIIIF